MSLEKGSAPEDRLRWVEGEIDALHTMYGGIESFQELGTVDYYVFEGGLRPQRQTEGAIGFDAYARAIVDPLSGPTPDNPLRRTLGDFQKGDDWLESIDPSIRDWVDDDEYDESKWALHLPRGKRVMVGLGFATRMRYPAFYWVAPRSGFASRGITIANSPGTVDPDYRGEAGALIQNNSDNEFVISHQMRIAQVIFTAAFIPRLDEVAKHGELGGTKRGVGGFGSTGSH